MNKVIIMGRICQNLELKRTMSGASVVSFNVAVDRGFKNANGENITDFLTVVAWNKTAEFVCKYFGKGRMILVEGSIQTRTWDTQNGEKRTAVEIIADKVHFTGEKREDVMQGNFEPITPAETTQDDFQPVDTDMDLPF